MVAMQEIFLFWVCDDNIATGCDKTRAAVWKYNVAVGSHVAAAGQIGESRRIVHFLLDLLKNKKTFSALLTLTNVETGPQWP